jgi:hypothetical protein
MGVFRAEEPGPRPAPPTAAAAVARVAARPPEIVRAPSMSATPRRTPQAIARPISSITIDGRLDDWPAWMRKYPIRNVLTDRTSSYRPEIRRDPLDLDAHFRVGYDAEAGLIYLAVVVRDDDLAIHGSGRKGPGGEVLQTDSVEVYVDGTSSNRKIREPSGDWRRELDAATMPVLQYVGIPGEVPAYGDPRGANPSLVYARTRETRTRMKYRRDEAAKATTYEWAIRPYDRFPDLPTRLEPGKRIGLEVAVVDKDSGRTKSAFVTWGSPPVVFKGCDAGSLGELLLSDGS